MNGLQVCCRSASEGALRLPPPPPPPLLFPLSSSHSGHVFMLAKLKEVPGLRGSDYINANFIDVSFFGLHLLISFALQRSHAAANTLIDFAQGYGEPQRYIATQGPLRSTTVDFWRMVWEQDVTTVVVLTGKTCLACKGMDRDRLTGAVVTFVVRAHP